MMKPRKLVSALLFAVLVLSACQKSTKVGDSDRLTIKQRQDAARALDLLGESPIPSSAPSSKPVGIGSSPTPAAKTSAPPQATSVLEIRLIHDSPYYDVGQEFSVSNGTKLRVTNADDQVRNFKNPDGAFDSGDLAPGKVWEYTVNLPKGKYSITDEHVPFATANLEVR